MKRDREQASMDWRSIWAVIITFNRDLLSFVVPMSLVLAIFITQTIFKERLILEKISIFLGIFLLSITLMLAVVSLTFGVRVGEVEMVVLP